MAVTPVAIAEYDPRWPEVYQEEKARIQGVIGHRVAALEHIGSTAVPGLAAKPIIDIMAGVRQLADAEECIGPLQGIGYQYVHHSVVGFPERRYFHREAADGQGYHLHMVERGGEFWERHLLFRDYLRAHPRVAAEYEELKREMAGRFGGDRDGYTEAKTSFIRSVEEKARALDNTPPSCTLPA